MQEARTDVDSLNIAYKCRFRFYVCFQHLNIWMLIRTVRAATVQGAINITHPRCRTENLELQRSLRTLSLAAKINATFVRPYINRA